MATNTIIPLLPDAQDEVVNNAWVPYMWMAASSREMIHERVMKLIRKRNADLQQIRALEGHALELLGELTRLRKKNRDNVALLAQMVGSVEMGLGK